MTDGRVAVVTGAAQGIGRRIAEVLAGEGYALALLDRQPVAGDLSWTGDVSSEADVTAFAKAVDDRFGRVDVLVNNAGVAFITPLEDTTLDEWRRVLDVNLTGAFVVSRTAARRFVAQGSGGRVVHLASMMSFHAGINTAAYAASKGGVAQLTKAQANEWAPLGIRVNAVAPGWVETELTKALRDDESRYREISARIPVGRWASAADIAGAVAFLCLPESDYVNGHVLAVDGGWLAR
jgi:2-deoxy-D-gluconate 3-dehydrogenase